MSDQAKADIEYLKKIAEKTINENDGRIPVKQLYDDDYEKFKGVNMQGHATNKPTPQQETLALYMIDADKKLAKRFTVTKSMIYLLLRGTERLIYGTSDPEGHQSKIILQWEKEIRLYPDQKETIPDGDKRTKVKKE